MHYRRKKPLTRAYIVFNFYEPNRRRDPDNISSYGRKAILDAFVEYGVLEGDGWKHIAGLADSFAVDKNRPRIEVELWEVSDDEG